MDVRTMMKKVLLLALVVGWGGCLMGAEIEWDGSSDVPVGGDIYYTDTNTDLTSTFTIYGTLEARGRGRIGLDITIASGGVLNVVGNHFGQRYWSAEEGSIVAGRDFTIINDGTMNVDTLSITGGRGGNDADDQDGDDDPEVPGAPGAPGGNATLINRGTINVATTFNFIPMYCGLSLGGQLGRDAAGGDFTLINDGTIVVKDESLLSLGSGSGSQEEGNGGNLIINSTSTGLFDVQSGKVKIQAGRGGLGHSGINDQGSPAIIFEPGSTGGDGGNVTIGPNLDFVFAPGTFLEISTANSNSGGNGSSGTSESPGIDGGDAGTTGKIEISPFTNFVIPSGVTFDVIVGSGGNGGNGGIDMGYGAGNGGSGGTQGTIDIPVGTTPSSLTIGPPGATGADGTGDNPGTGGSGALAGIAKSNATDLTEDYIIETPWTLEENTCIDGTNPTGENYNVVLAPGGEIILGDYDLKVQNVTSLFPDCENAPVDDSTIVLTENWLIDGTREFTEDTLIIGNGFEIVLEATDKLDIAPGVEVIFEDVTISGIQDHNSSSNVCCGVGSRIVLKNSIWNQAESYTFNCGELVIRDDNVFSGEETTFEITDGTITVEANSSMFISKNMRFKYNVVGFNDRIVLVDDTSILGFQRATLHAAQSLKLKDGKIFIGRGKTIFEGNPGTLDVRCIDMTYFLHRACVRTRGNVLLPWLKRRRLNKHASRLMGRLLPVVEL